MDTGEGRMELLSKGDAKLADEHGIPVFEIGEIIEIKGSKFRVHTIQREGIVLKVLESKTVKSMVDMFKQTARP